MNHAIPASEVRTSAKLLFLMVGNENEQSCDDLQYDNLHAELYENAAVG
jgi:hypothetical protein